MTPYIVFCLISIVNSFTFMFAMTNLLLYPIEKRNKLFVLIYLALCQIFFGMLLGQAIILFTIGGALLIIAFSNKHFISNSFLSLLGYLIAVLINYIMTVPLYLCNISITYISSHSCYSFIFTIIYGLATYTITAFLGTYLRKKFSSYSIAIPSKLQFFLMLELILCTLIFVYNIRQEEKMNYPTSAIYFNAILFVTFFVVTIILFIFCLRMLRTQQEKQSLEEYMRKLEDLYQDMRIFRHDYINILSTMTYYIDNNEMEHLKEYFQFKILPTSRKLAGKDAVIGKLSNIKLLELKGILYVKLITAMNQDLNITLEIQDEINNISMEMIDLATVLGALMDNAIEAAKTSTSQNLVILLIDSFDSVTIVISNAASETDIKLDRIYGKNITSKPGHSGLGLYSVSRILAKYNNIIHSTNFENNIFTQKLEICKR